MNITFKTTAVTAALLAMTILISGCSNAEDELTNIVEKRWHHKWVIKSR